LVERAGRTARRWHILRRGGRTTSPTSVGSSSRSGCATGWPRAAGAGCRSRRGWASSPALVADRRPRTSSPIFSYLAMVPEMGGGRSF
jgi:hypothetical protein